MKTTLTCLAALCLVFAAQPTFAGKPNETAQILDAVFGGVSNIIESATQPGPGGWGGPQYYEWEDDSPTYYYPTTTYVQQEYVTPTVPSNPLPTNTLPSNPVPSNPLPQAAQILVVNPKSNTVALSFTVDNQSYTLAPGHARQFSQTGTIQFSRGGSYGNGRYTMIDGKYSFEMVNGRGWELYHLVK